MNAARRLLTLVALMLFSALAQAESVNYEMVTVGNPGNANDTGGIGIGAVGYEYQIGKYDVTIGQYTAFLNAIDPDGTNLHGCYIPFMRTDLNIAGISYNSGASSGSKYSVMNNGGDSANRPITYVSWFDAARFANWMTNGQGSGSTETGAYTLNGATSGNGVVANPGAAFRLPTESEWYKAAFYSPNKDGPGVPGYYAYATQSDTAPGNQIGSATNQANYYTLPLGMSVTHSLFYDEHNQNYLTDVGAFSGSGSFYGTFDQSGNVYQWNDLDGNPGSFPGLHGGSFFWGSVFNLSSSDYQGGRAPSTARDPKFGFRLASPVPVPEPSTCAMALAGIACGGWGVWRRRKRA